MKFNLLFIALLIPIFLNAQSSKRMVKIDMIEQNNKYIASANEAMSVTDQKYASKIKELTKPLRLDTFSEYKKPETDTVSRLKFKGYVVEKTSNSMLIMSTHFSKWFRSGTVPQIQIGETIPLETGKEYWFRLEYFQSLRNEKHCSGCTGILESRLIWYSPTKGQVMKDTSNYSKVESQ